MIWISVYSILSAVLWSIPMLLVLHFYRGRHEIQNANEQRIFTILYVLILLRLALPFDSKWMKGVTLRGLYSDIYEIFNFHYITIRGFKITIFQFICAIILAVSAYKIFQFVRENRRFYHVYDLCDPYYPERIAEANRRLKIVLPAIPDAEILLVNHQTSPFITGIKNKRIIIPDMDFSDDDLFYILMHEYSHILGHHYLLLYFVDLLLCLFWWLPFSRFLGEDFMQMIEISCDKMVMKRLTPAEYEGYLKTIIIFVSITPWAMIKKEQKIAIPLVIKSTKRSSSILERFKVISSVKNYKIPQKTLIIFVCSIALLITSYLLCLQPGYDPPFVDIIGENGEAVEITSKDRYILLSNNQYYFVNVHTGQKSLILEEALPILLEGGDFDIIEEYT